MGCFRLLGMNYENKMIDKISCPQLAMTLLVTSHHDCCDDDDYC